MFRSRSLLAITVSLFLLGQLYVFFSVVPLPQHSSPASSPPASVEELSLSALACRCPPASAHKYRGFSAHDPELNYSNTPTSSIRFPTFYAPAPSSPSIPLVSVIVPYYNSATTIQETLRSVLQQSLQAFEIIIVDDASPASGTDAVLYKMKKLDARIRVMRNVVNGGLAATRNADSNRRIGAKEARGEFLYFLDADDLIEPLTLEISTWYLHCRRSLAFVGGWTVGFGAQQYVWKKGFDDPSVFVRDNVVTATKMVRKQHFLDIGGFDSKLRHGNEDWEFWLRMANAGYWGATLSQPFDWYRRKAREQSNQEWATWTEKGRVEFLEAMATRYPRLFSEGKFPQPVLESADRANISNPLKRGPAKRVLIVTAPRPLEDPILGAEDITADAWVLAPFLDVPDQLAPFVLYALLAAYPVPAQSVTIFIFEIKIRGLIKLQIYEPISLP